MTPVVGEERDPGVDPEGAEQRQELADEAARARQADIGHGEDHEQRRHRSACG